MADAGISISDPTCPVSCQLLIDPPSDAVIVFSGCDLSDPTVKSCTSVVTVTATVTRYGSILALIEIAEVTITFVTECFYFDFTSLELGE